MEPIADKESLLERLRTLFPPDIAPGLRGEIVDVDRDAGTATVRYDVSEGWANQLGAAQGGAVATMLDGCIGVAGTAYSGGILAMPVAELNVSFVRPVPIGVVHGTGVVIRLGRKVGFIEATLSDAGGRVLARGTGTAIPVPFPDVDLRRA